MYFIAKFLGTRLMRELAMSGFKSVGCNTEEINAY